MFDTLSTLFPKFAAMIEAYPRADPEHVLQPCSLEEIAQIETELGIPLPDSYKKFLQVTRGFWLFGGMVQITIMHPHFHKFPRLDELTSEQRQYAMAKSDGSWPPPSEGMLCFAEYFRDADGDQVLFDVFDGLVKGEYPVMYYSHETWPPFVEKVAGSFDEWLNEKCVQQIKGEDDDEDVTSIT